MYYYILYQDQEQHSFRQLCMECELLFQLQSYCFPFKYTLWTFIYFALLIYTIVLTVSSLTILKANCTEQIALQMKVQSVLIAVKLLKYVILSLRWRRMFPFVNERMKSTQEAIHYYLRIKEFAMMHKCLIGFSLIFSVIVMVWTIFGISQVTQENASNGVCSQNGVTIVNLKIAGTIIPIMIIETISYIFEIIFYQFITRKNRTEVSLYFKQHDKFNQQNVYQRQIDQKPDIFELQRQLAQNEQESRETKIIKQSHYNQNIIDTTNSVNEKIRRSQTVQVQNSQMGYQYPVNYFPHEPPLEVNMQNNQMYNPTNDYHIQNQRYNF